MPLYSGREPAVETVNNNAYYRPGKPLGGEIFFDQGWGAWRGKGFDKASLLNVDPGFVDAQAGDYNLVSGSPLHKIGFEPLPFPLCPRLGR